MASSLPRTVRLGTDAYCSLLDELEAHAEAGEGICLLLAGGGEEDAQQLLADLAEVTKLSAHQFSIDQLQGERGIQTQGNLREVFDSSFGEAVILFFDHVEVLLRDVPLPGEVPQAETVDEDDDTLRPIDYLFDRIDAHPGAVVLHLVDASFASRIAEDVDVVVEARGERGETRRG